MKRIHRLIVTSQTYQLSSAIPAHHRGPQIDRDNVYMWRFTPQRMESEAIRDSMLLVAGELDFQMGGQEVEHEAAPQSHRRSVYISHHGETRFVMLDLFDAANPNECYRRTSSVRPQQALALMNSDFAAALGRSVAERVWNDTQQSIPPQEDANARFVEALFLRILCRKPAENELATCLEFLRIQTDLLAQSDLTNVAAPTVGQPPSSDPAQRAREGLAHALFSHTDFITLR